MVGSETIRRLRWHAGLADIDGPGLANLDGSRVPSVSSSTWSPGKRTPELERAVGDFIDVLQELNLEVNGATPSGTIDVEEPDSISRHAAYAVAIVVSMLDEHGEAEGEAWQVETAWLGLLAGDIDDLRAHVAKEKAARRG